MPGVSTSSSCALAFDRDAHQAGARGLRLGADDRDLLPDQRIDQRRLARVGRAEHGDAGRSGGGQSSTGPHFLPQREGKFLQ